ncbi:Retrovirus-related Pol polyprotein from transposon TNT 1-94, partial [Acromyrmex echinatior]
MNVSAVSRIETLNKDNYDTWKMQMQAILVKTNAWKYVNGTDVKTELVADDDGISAQARAEWDDNDSKAMSDLILSIHPSELKQIKGCTSSREIWLRLEGIYQSKGPARKATLLKRLALQKMADGEDVREHIRTFFDAVDKLTEMEVIINPDLLAILLLYSLPSQYENFRCAIESRDELPTPEALRIKIIEKSDVRKKDNILVQNAMAIKPYANKNWKNKKKATSKNEDKEKSKLKCHSCGKIGHKAADC